MKQAEFPKALTDRIDKAMDSVYLWPDIELLIQLEQQSVQSVFEKKGEKKKREKQLQEMQKNISPLIVTSLEELRMVLQYLEVDEDIEHDTVQDMYFQSKMAEDKGYQSRFSVWFYRTMDDGVAIYCSIQIGLPAA